MSKQDEANTAKDLVRRIIAGDHVAEKDMIERYNDGMVFMLRHRSKNPALAEDLAQETWRIILEKVRAGDLNDPTKLAAYIIQTAKNQLLMTYRGSYNTKMSHDVDMDQTLDPAEQPSQLVERMNMAKVVKVLVDELNSPRDRDLIARFYLQEEDKKKICEDFGLSELHFNRVLFRARQRFKQIWQERMESHQ